MAQTGRPPKTAEQKRRTGNPGKRPLPAVGSLALVPPVGAPPRLDVAATLEAVVSEGAHWIAATDAPTLALLRDTLADREKLREAIAVLGFDKDLWAAMRAIDKQAHTLLSQLGFDPAARSRLGLAEVAAASKLEEMRARKEGRSR